MAHDSAGKCDSKVIVILTDVKEKLLESCSPVELAFVQLRQAVHVTVQVLVGDLWHFLDPLIKIRDPDSVVVYFSREEQLVRRGLFVEDGVIGQTRRHQSLSDDGQVELNRKGFFDVKHKVRVLDHVDPES